jgi:nuclear transport factor 2 (NTF2) superfamily protein
MAYIRGLKFDQEADYGVLKTMFTLLKRRLEVPVDYQYEWERQEEGAKPRPRKGSCLIS